MALKSPVSSFIITNNLQKTLLLKNKTLLKVPYCLNLLGALAGEASVIAKPYLKYHDDDVPSYP
jgi:hypothetical protein